MTLRSQMKLDLSLMMIGLNGRKNVLNDILQKAPSIGSLGRFLQTRRTSAKNVTSYLAHEEVSLDFENGTLDVELIKNLNTEDEIINNFNFR